MDKHHESRADRFPHNGVYARLGQSAIHGVGVIAVVAIKKGTAIFPDDDDDLLWIDIDDLPPMSAFQRQFYDDFCVRRGDSFGCPKSFNKLTASWYLNHSVAPNVECDPEYCFIALRDIRAGEELTVDYRTFSDGELPSQDHDETGS